MADRQVEDGAALDELFETVRYHGEIKPWAKVPETEESEDEPEYQPTRRDMSERMFICAVKQHTGLLVSLWLDPATAEQIALPNGEKPEDMHITLCYCGDVSEIGPEGIFEAQNIVASIAAQTHGPIIGRLGGVGYFLPSEQSDSKVPVYAVPDVPGLSELRSAIATGLADAGIPPRGDHGWTPHITLYYAADLPDDMPGVPDLPLVFTEICVSIGDERVTFPLLPSGQPEAISLYDPIRYDNPPLSQVRGPVPLVAVQKTKRRKRPVYWQGNQYARKPTPFECSVMSLADIPARMKAEQDMTVYELSNVRAASINALHLSETYDTPDGIVTVLRDMQERMARYGAYEVDQECRRQGMKLDATSGSNDVAYDVIGQQSRLNPMLSSSADAACQRISTDWQSHLKSVRRRLARSSKRNATKAKSLMESMASARISTGLQQHVSELSNEALNFGRRTRQRQIVANKRFSLASKHDDDDVSDLVDYVVQTAIHDKNLCENCEAIDGTVFELGTEEQEDAEPPYAECEGGDKCRCLQVLVVGDWRDKEAVRDAVGSDRLQVATERQAEALIKQRQALQSEGDE